MKTAKKRMAMLMAFVMLFSTVVPMWPRTVWANPTLNINMMQHLVNGGAFLVPGQQASVVGTADPFTIGWDISANPSHDYRLSYYLNDYTRVDLFVLRRFAEAQVFYEVWDTSSNPPVRITHSAHNFNIWNNITQSWVPPNAHPNIEPWRGTGHLNMPVMHPNTILPFDIHGYFYGGHEFWGHYDDTTTPPTPLPLPPTHEGGITANQLFHGTPGTPTQQWLTPSFNITQGGGFSFRYGTGFSNAEVHFRWTPQGMFEVSSSGMQTGRVYEFNLSQRPAVEGQAVDVGWVHASTQNALKGINQDNVIVIPRGGPLRTTVPPHASDVRDSREPYQDDPGPPFGRGIDMLIPLPDILTPPTAPYGNTYGHFDNIGFDVYVIVALGPFSLVFLLEQSGNLVVYQGAPELTHSDVVQDPATGQWFIEFHLDDGRLTPGLIFDTSIGFTSVVPSLLNSRVTMLPFGRVFTFPEFTISPMRDMHVVRVTPFRSAISPHPLVHGWYMLIRDYVTPGLGPARQEPPVWMDSEAPFLEIPMRMGDPTHEFFQILFNPNPEQFPTNPNPHNFPRSQILQYWPEQQEQVSIPEHFRITNVEQLPLEGELSREWAYVEMTLNWDIGDMDLVHSLVGASPLATPGALHRELSLVYGVNFDPTPDNLSPPRLGDIGMRIVTAAALTPGAGDRLLVRYYTEGLDGNMRPWPFELVSPDDWVELVPDPQSPGRFLAQVRVRMRAAHIGAFGGFMPDLRYPNIYFLNVYPILQNGVSPVGVDYSNFYPLTLSDLSMPEVPPPQGLQITNETTYTYALGDALDRVSFDLSWSVPGPLLHEYVLRSFGFPPDQARVSMNIYISQNEAFMRDTFAGRGWPERITAGDVRNVFYAPDPALPSTAVENWMRFSTINGDAPMGTDGAAEPRDYLRQTAHPGGINVLRIEGVELQLTTPSALAPASYDFSFTLDGLDKNEQYFVFVDVVVEFYDAAVPPQVQDDFTRASHLAGLVGVTTIGDPDIPTGEDMVPAVPYPLNARNISSDSATIYWPPVDSGHPDAHIEYEIIRIHTSEMPAELREGRTPFPQIWQMVVDGVAPDGVEAWRTTTVVDPVTGEDTFELHRFDGTGFNAQAQLPYFDFFIDWDEGEVVFVDNTLQANELYFYYVRARRTMGAAPTYSLWNDISVTTVPIEAPVNLRVVTGRDDNDPLSEVWLSFDVPISTLDRLGPYLNVELQMRQDDGEWQSYGILDAETLLSVPQPPVPVPASEGFSGGFQFMYLVGGLQHGTAYQFRVRLIDQNNVASLFSNVVTWRTDLDQGEWDDDRLTDDWLLHLRREMERLLRTYYWVSANTPNTFEVFMRPTMADALIARTPGAQIVLPSSPLGDVNQSIYYIPMGMYNAATAANKGFRIDNGDLSIFLPPGMITYNNTAVLAMAEAINHREYADSFVRINASWLNHEQIEGNDVLGRAVHLSFDIVGARGGATAWDNNLLATLEARLEVWADDPMYREAFLNSVRQGTTPHDLSRYVLAILDVSGANIVGVVNNAKAGFVAGGFPVDVLQRGFTLAVSGLEHNAAVQGFVGGDAGWLPIEATQVGDGRGIIANRPGSFALVGRLVDIPGIQNVVRGGTMTGIVARYGLDDFLGRDSIDLDAWATRQMVIGSVARLAGAPRAADPANWLRQNGVNVSARGAGQDIQAQEAAALLIHVYEVRTGTRANTIRIRNQNAINTLEYYNPALRDSLRVAIELGLIDPEVFNPSLRLTKRELLQMLGDIDRISRI